MHGVDNEGKVVITRQLRRKQVIDFFSKIPACLIGMEACGTAHHWAREISKLGHTVRLMPPSYVKGLSNGRRTMPPTQPPSVRP
jgi:transposase